MLILALFTKVHNAMWEGFCNLKANSNSNLISERKCEKIWRNRKFQFVNDSNFDEGHGGPDNLLPFFMKGRSNKCMRMIS